MAVKSDKGRTPAYANVTDAAASGDGLEVLLAARAALAADMDNPGTTMIRPQIAARLQALNREIDERLGAVSPAGAAKGQPAEPEPDPDDELSAFRKRAGR